MEHLTNWFFNLPLQTAVGVVFFGAIIIGCTAVIVTDELVKLVVQQRIAVDEFTDAEDSTASVAFDSSHVSMIFMRDDSKDALAALATLSVAEVDDYYRRIDLKSYTCTLCAAQYRRPSAFDAYCTDGDCLEK